ncbi:EAL domain-containing protein [Corticibacter populi]|uniref:Diguanylate cyclase DosC n=1 Tax=Corticibacter populi TaxID=1550736 RepID=A0A3M6R013_9BURK|nr:EAL domain-containing protein [Corticibacter populi]RMX08610.1 EAL domain-containing protein [Corticibacter populi]RZS35939.1 PAS domain S-box-containing protein/diguanylate cyclase (GGDEF)-like protein [Corticibacter populi]
MNDFTAHRGLSKPPEAIDPSTCEAHRQRMGIDAETAALLHRLQPFFQRYGRDLVDGFYRHFASAPELQPLIGDEATLERLKQAQFDYFQELCCGHYGSAYFEKRARMGRVHADIGLSPSWHLSAYAHYLEQMLPMLARQLGEASQPLIPALQALLKIMLLDIELAISAYIKQRDAIIGELHDYRTVFAQLPFATMVIDQDLVVHFANQAFEKLFDIAVLDIEGQALGRFMDCPDLARLTQQVRPKQQFEAFTWLSCLNRPTPARYPVNLCISLLPGVPADQRRLLLVIEDQRHRIQLESELQKAQAAAGVGSWRINMLDDSLLLSHEAADIYGLGPATPMTLKAFLGLVHRADRRALRQAWRKALRGEPLLFEHRFRRNGQEHWMEVRGQVAFEKIFQVPISLSGMVHDITERKQSEAQIHQLAFYDPLTGLPNRAMALQQLHSWLAHHGSDRLAGLLFIDLDHFKNINDSKGHSVGDQVLVDVVRRLAQVLRPNEMLTRIGGDEFVVLLHNTERSAASATARRLLGILEQPVIHQQQRLSLGMSIGIALFPSDGRSAEDLLKHADIAMYSAKRAGGNNFAFYHPDMSRDIERATFLQGKLEHALQHGLLRVHYQPIIALRHSQARRMQGAEALLRWDDSEWGWISPSEFIPLAEARGMIHRVGDWTLSEVCRQIRRWKDAALSPNGRISVNISAQQIERVDFVDHISRLVRNAGIAPADLELELTERVLIKNPQAAWQVGQELSARGFLLSIDDFGTHYSSLEQLQRIPAQKLKLDMVFIRDMLKSPKHFKLVQSIIRMAHSMQMRTVAEGVENVQQALALAEMGCNQAQGFLFSRALAADELADHWLMPAFSRTQH